MRLALPFIFLLAISLEAPAQIPESSRIPREAMHLASQAATFSQTIDRIIAKEHALIELMDNLTPLVETYIQIVRPDQQIGMVPIRDEYFLGQLAAERDIKVTSYIREPAVLNQIGSLFGNRYRTRFKAQGFTRMIFPDKENFDRMHYDFRYAGRELLGDAFCLRIDVLPKPGSGQGRFLGRIWVEDEDFTIVRFNGALTNHPKFKKSVHLDSWRLNVLPTVWLPAYVYSEDSDSHGLRYRAQTRLWAYDLQHAGDHREFEQKLADSIIAGDHIDAGVELSPVLSERSSQHSGEEDVIERLQVAGLVAPDGEVDRVLESIAKDLVLTNANEANGLFDVRCRVLLTLPLDSFSVGHTIFISRGLLDVLPDDGTLALLLAHELGHIISGHSVIAESAFSDDVLLSNEQVLSRFARFHRDRAEEHTADVKALELLANSQFRQKLSRAARFLQELNGRSSQLPNLICPHLRLAGQDLLIAPLTRSAAKADVQSRDPAALPLGSRIKLNPWNNRIQLVQPVLDSMLLMRERMPLQITPFHPYLSRSPLAVAAAPTRE